MFKARTKLNQKDKIWFKFLSLEGAERRCYKAKRPNSMLKTEPKQLLDSQLLQSIGDRVVTVGFYMFNVYSKTLKTNYYLTANHYF